MLLRCRKVALTALVVLGAMFPFGAQAEETIKIALVETLSGPLANTGDLGLRHFRYKIDKMNEAGGVLGKKFELVTFDNKGSPQEALVLLRRIADEGISYVTHGNGSHIASALINGLNRHNSRSPNKILYFNFAAVDPALTQSECSFWHFSFDANSEMKMEALTSFIAEAEDAKKVFLVNMDYAHGHQVSEATQRLLPQKNADVEIVGDVFHPIGRVKDFSPYIAQIRSSGADTVITGNWGNDLTLLVRAAASADLNVKFYTYYGGGLGAPAALSRSGEDRVYQITGYHRNLPFELGKEEAYDFILPFDEQNGKIDWYYESINMQMDMLKKAIETVGSADPLKVALALEGMHHTTPYAEVVMRKEDHQLLQPLYISKLTKDAKYDVEETGLGFSTVKSYSVEDTAIPVACEVKRP